MGIRCADHVTVLYPQKLALTSQTGGGRSVGIVRSRTKATEFFLSTMITTVHDVFGMLFRPAIPSEPASLNETILCAAHCQ